jgi:predicted GIY-YIG superfamily endonuclease
VLYSEKDEQLYTGYTSDIKKRLVLHNEGKVESTKNADLSNLFIGKAALISKMLPEEKNI